MLQGRLPDYNDPVVLPANRNTVGNPLKMMSGFSSTMLSSLRCTLILAILSLSHSGLLCRWRASATEYTKASSSSSSMPLYGGHQ